MMSFRKRPKETTVTASTLGNDKVGLTCRTLIVVAIVLFALTRYYILFVLVSKLGDHYQITDLYSEYFEYVTRANDLHQTPYQNDFKVEYPPVGWWTIDLPRTLDYRVVADPKDPAQSMPVFFSYIFAFRGQMCLIDVAAFAIFLALALRRKPSLAGWAALFYVIVTAILGRLIYDRLDVGLLFLLILWAYAWQRSLAESKWALWWSAAAYLVIGLSVSYKIIPVVCLPFLGLSEFVARKRATRLTVAIAALAAGIGLPFMIQFAISGPGIFALFKHHAEREIQIESLYSTLMMVFATSKSPVFITHSHGAFNLTGSASHIMKWIATLSMLGFLSGMGVWALLRWKRYGRRAAYCFSCYVIAGVVILSNVLSPQYFIWALPVILLLALEIIEPDEKLLPWLLGAALLGVVVMTTWIFPYHYFATPASPGLIPFNRADPLDTSSQACVVLVLRNFAYLGMMIWLGVLLYLRIDRISTADSVVQSVR